MPAVVAIQIPNRQPPTHLISSETHALVLAIRRGIPRATTITSLTTDAQLGGENTISKFFALDTFLRPSMVDRVPLVAPVSCLAHAAPGTSRPGASTIAHRSQTVVYRCAACSWSVATGCALGLLVPVQEISIADRAAVNCQRV